MDRESRAYWIRLAKSAAFLALGAAIHVWLLPSTHFESDELVAVSEPPGFAPLTSQPDARSVIALLESTSDDLAGAPPRSLLAPQPAPVGTSGRVTIAVENVPVRSIFERPLDRLRVQPDPNPQRLAEASATDATVETPSPAGTTGTVGTTGSIGLVGSMPTARTADLVEPAVGSTPTAELELASDALSPDRRSLHDAVAVAKPAASADAPQIAVHARQLMDDEQMVRLVLQQYRTAYEQLDASAAKSVWPTVDERALTHAFQQLASQRLTFRSCGISITGTGANARCRGEAEYRPKIGAKRALTTSGEWVFDLAREQTSWRIINASVQ